MTTALTTALPTVAILVILALGFATGLRTMTAITVLCWFAWRGDIPVGGTWAFWIASPVAVVVFTLLAAGEYVGDKLPKTPNRTDAGPLIARLVFAGLGGAVLAASFHAAPLKGILAGVAGALIGAFGGYFARRSLVKTTRRPDWNIAVMEDLCALAISIFALLSLLSIVPHRG